MEPPTYFATVTPMTLAENMSSLAGELGVIDPCVDLGIDFCRMRA
jgi:hypothetical protein